MVTTRKVISLAVWSTLFASFPLLAGDAYVCQMDTQERHISITYINEGMTVPCQVNYVKEDGSPQVLWDAQNAEGYCEQKAAEFVEKQRGWGWDCMEEAK